MPTIGGSVIHNAARVPDRLALVAGRRRWTWAEIDREVAQVAARLRSAGLRAGDRFATVTENSAATVIAYFAAARLGAIIVPVNARLAAPEIAHIISDAGATVVASAHELDFEPGEVLATIERERITALLGVPTMYQFLLRHPEVGKHDTSSWRVGVFGAAPMPAETIENLLARFPGVSFFQQCGQTEAGPTGIYSTSAQVRSRPQSSGHLAQPFVEARIVDESGADVAAGEIGELVLRGEAVMKGYWRRPDATAEVLRDGWLHTGDLLQFYSDGAMRLVDRLKDVIITGGRNVYSAEVEQALAGHPGIADCAVVGRPHPDWGETIVVVLTPREGHQPDLESVREYCRSRIAGYKLPRELHIAPVPRTPSGKIQKHLIRQELSKEN